MVNFKDFVTSLGSLVKPVRNIANTVGFASSTAAAGLTLYWHIKSVLSGPANYVFETPLVVLLICIPLLFLANSDVGLGKRKTRTIFGVFRDGPSAWSFLWWYLLSWFSIATILGSVLFTFFKESKTLSSSIAAPIIVTSVATIFCSVYIVRKFYAFEKVKTSNEMPNIAMPAVIAASVPCACAVLLAVYVRCSALTYFAVTVLVLAYVVLQYLATPFEHGEFEEDTLEELKAAAGLAFDARKVDEITNANGDRIAYKLVTRKRSTNFRWWLVVVALVIVGTAVWVPVSYEITCRSCLYEWLRETYKTLRDSSDKMLLWDKILKRCEPAQDTAPSIVGRAFSAFMDAWNTGAAEDMHAQYSKPPAIAEPPATESTIRTTDHFVIFDDDDSGSRPGSSGESGAFAFLPSFSWTWSRGEGSESE